jgi:hypothetical protein
MIKRLVFAQLLLIGIMLQLAAAPAAGEIEVSGKRLDLGVERGKKFLTVGLFHGGAPIGVDFEYALSRAVGLQAGIGLTGIDLGMNFHLTSDLRKDIYFSVIGVYVPIIDNLVAPGAAFGLRRYFGEKARAGIGLELGFLLTFKDYSPGILDDVFTFDKNQVIPRIGLGATFKLR